MERLSFIVESLDEFFKVRELERDPSMSRWVPMVYDAIGFDWKRRFESDFTNRFNGLMLRGGQTVNTVFCSVFPTVDVLERFIKRSAKGDMLFLHHPIDIECGDPFGKAGRGFLPIESHVLDELSRKQLSVYSCHAPLDTHPEIGTGAAIVEALEAQFEDRFYPYGNGFAGVICSVHKTNHDELVRKLKQIFGITYVDLAGKPQNEVSRIAIVPGAGYKVNYLQEVEAKGVEAYLTGEIFNRIEGDYGKKAFREVMKFAQSTRMSLIGVSHAASEYLVMKTQMVRWFESKVNLAARPLPLIRWWR